MRKSLLILAGIFAFAALWKKEADEDGVGIAASPFLAALVIDAAILLLSRKRNTLLSDA
ncbi:MAG TPA: hypothetical protein VG274_02035 [Rhizomicrobium sp.]|jgi:hypothetical protein|nr:hypothetical protein [Rhizomicrobium sp.]